MLKYNRLLSTGTFGYKTNNSNFITPVFTCHGHIHAWTTFIMAMTPEYKSDKNIELVLQVNVIPVDSRRLYFNT